MTTSTTASRPTPVQHDVLTAGISRPLTIKGVSTRLDADLVSRRVANTVIEAGWATETDDGHLEITHDGRAVLDQPLLRGDPPPSRDPGGGRAAALIEPADGQLVQIPVDQLHPAADNPREGTGDPDRLAELADSIRTQGLLQPLVVVAREAGGWMIVAGHRRHAAALLAEQHDVPCVVRTMTDGERRAAMLVENLHRADLDPLEEARGYAQLRELGWAQALIAKQVGRDQGTVSRRLKLLDLVPEAVAQIRAGHLTLDTAAKLARLQPKTQKGLIKRHAGTSWMDQSIAGEISKAAEDTRALRARRVAHGDLIDAGVEVVTDVDKPLRDWWELEQILTPLDRLEQRGVDVAGHADQPCHAAGILRDGTVVLGCTSTSNHQLAEVERPADPARAAWEAARATWAAAYEPRRKWLAGYLGELTEAAQATSWTPDHDLLLYTATLLGRAVLGDGRLADLIGMGEWEAQKPVRAGELHPVVLAYAMAISRGEGESADAYDDKHRTWTSYGDGPDTPTVDLHLAELDRIGCPDHAALVDLLTVQDDATAAAA